MIQPLPDGTYELKIGKSFSKSSKNKQEYQTLRYDFKPKSVNAEQETYIATTDNGDVHVALANDASDNLTMYKGAGKSLKDGKECLLIFDEECGELRLEKVTTNLNLKQTRDVSDEIKHAIRSKIDQQRKRKPPKSVRDSPKEKPTERSGEKSTEKLTEETTQRPSSSNNRAKRKDIEDAIMSSSSSEEEEDGEIVEDTQKSTAQDAITQDEESAENPRRYSFNLSSRSASPSVSTSSEDDEFAAELERRINAGSSSPEPAVQATGNEEDDMPDLFGSTSNNQASTVISDKPSSTNRCQLTMDLALSDTSDDDE